MKVAQLIRTLDHIDHTGRTRTGGDTLTSLHKETNDAQS